MSNETNQVAETIRTQLGHMCLRMLGAQNLVAGENFLQFKIRGSRAVNRIRIELSPLDTYTMTFFKITGVKVKEIASVDGVYADQMHKVIESSTGLYTSI